MTVAIFLDPMGIVFSVLPLSSVKKEVHYAFAVERPFYPDSWCVRVKGDKDTNSGRPKSGGGDGGGEGRGG